MSNKQPEPAPEAPIPSAWLGRPYDPYRPIPSPKPNINTLAARKREAEELATIAAQEDAE